MLNTKFLVAPLLLTGTKLRIRLFLCREIVQVSFTRDETSRELYQTLKVYSMNTLNRLLYNDTRQGYVRDILPGGMIDGTHVKWSKHSALFSRCIDEFPQNIPT